MIQNWIYCGAEFPTIHEWDVQIRFVVIKFGPNLKIDIRCHHAIPSYEDEYVLYINILIHVASFVLGIVIVNNYYIH